MNIHFGREICGHLESSNRREWLVTNGIGGYACGTVSGVLTRRYHGYLLAADPSPVERYLLLTKIAETVEYENQIYPLDTNLWQDETVAPQGYLHLESFHLEETIPVWRYACADALLEKRIWMEKGQNTTYIYYKLMRAKKSIKIFFQPLINYRNYHHITDQIFNFFSIEAVNNGLRFQANEVGLPLFLLSSAVKFERNHQWFYNFQLSLEKYRGLEFIEHHFQGAKGRIILEPGQSITIVATTENQPCLDGEESLKRYQDQEQNLLEYEPLKQTPYWIKQLALAGDQFIVKRSLSNLPNGKTIIAGYPWFGDWGRDTMIALPGLTLTTGRSDVAKLILETFSHYLDQGMLPNVFPDQGTIPYYNSVDSVLWYFQAISEYLETTKDRAFLVKLYPLLAEVIDWYNRGTRYQIHRDDDGLIYAGKTGVQLTWMDAKVGDYVVTPRIGKAIEINALWYNALVLMKQWSDQLEKNSAEYEQLGSHTHLGFQRFWYEKGGYAYDVLDTPTGNDPSLRPNQIFAVSLPKKIKNIPSLFSQNQQRLIVDTVAFHLLTSYGLRSLSPEDYHYQGNYGGDQLKRDSAYHQGTTWGWLIGHFIQAHLKVYQNPRLAKSYLQPFEDHLFDGGLGTISEIFDGNIPFIPRGCFSQAWSVAEVLRAWFLIENSV